MNVFFGLDDLPLFKNAVLTIGTFDGVHEGHQVIIRRLKQKAEEIDGESVIITFDPHPRFVIVSENPPIALLNTLGEKIRNLSREGVQNLVVVNFTHEFASMDAADYIEKFLIEKFHPHTLIIGYDHLFGKGRKGNFKLLEQMKSAFHFQLEEIPMQVIEQNKISSTQIRQALLSGDVSRAARFLGTPYSIQGIVTEGKKKGRQLGYPTANIEIHDMHKLIPARGVYAVFVLYAGEEYKGMLNIGTNPTMARDNHQSIEVNIFDFDRQIYGEKLEISFIARLRDEQRFESLQALTEALARDKEQAVKLLG